MRRLLGGVVWVAGIGGLGWYAAEGPARAMEASLEAAAEDIAAGTQHGVTTAVLGRDIVVSGLVEDAAEQESVLAALDAIEGRRVVTADALTVLPVVDPYEMQIAYDGSDTVLTGYAPSAAAADQLGGQDLTIANGEPENWVPAVTGAREALSLLRNGVVQLRGTQVQATGLAATPDVLAAFNAAMADLPAGYTTTSFISVEDDGTPLRLTLNYDGAVLSGSGKIPANLEIGAVSIDGAETALDIKEAVLVSEDGAWPDFALSGVAALAALGQGDLALEGKAMRLTGTGTPDQISAAKAALADVAPGYSVETDIALYDDGAPFTLKVDKTETGLQASGKVPADLDAALLADQDEVQRAFIVDETGLWPGIAVAGLAALDRLETGTLEVGAQDLALAGVAFSPVERDAALEALGDYAVTTDIALLDDGAPVALTLTYNVETGAAVSGKLPRDLTPVDVAEALEMEVADEGATQAAFGVEVDLLAPLHELKDFLPELSGLTYIAKADATSLDARTVPGVDAVALGTALQAALGDGVVINVAPRTDLPAPGTTRVNRFSGREEVFTSGYWLPTFDFFATPESCSAQSDIVLATDQVRFVTGSAELDVQSIRAINALAALARKCALEGGVFLQIAGHTDATGDADANLALSQARADAVRSAILARGVAGVVVSAVGYGDTQPVADNDTDAGRAANRRTEFIWNFE